jgi:hypothetical protein
MLWDSTLVGTPGYSLIRYSLIEILSKVVHPFKSPRLQVDGETIEICTRGAALLGLNHRKMRLPRASVTSSPTPANKSASLRRNCEEGSNVIDTSERQSAKQYAPMKVTEAGR